MTCVSYYVAGEDFVLLDRVVRFPAGSMINVTVCENITLIDDCNYEKPENFTVHIDVVEDNIIIANLSRYATVQIMDDEGLYR